MIDVFIRTKGEQSSLRKAMYLVSTARWELEPARVMTIKDCGIGAARVMAEDLSESDPYIFTDDDVLIVGKDWVERGQRAMLAHPDIAVASSLSLVEGENLAKPPDWSNAWAEKGNPSIYEMHAVGAPMWIRKGILTNLPELTLDQECGQIHKLVLNMGYKEGLINGLRHNHIGHGFSSNPALHWGF